MSGKLKELQDSLLTELGGTTVQFGFDAKPIGQSFYRKFNGGKHALHVSFIRHKVPMVDLDITADIAVRFDALEELANEFNPRLSRKERLQTFSLGCELGNLSGEGQCRWTIVERADVVKAASGVIEKFRVVGLPYLEKFSSLENVLIALSGDDKAAWLHSPVHDNRAMRAIAAAYLLNEKQKCLELIEKKTRFLGERNDFGLQGFLEMTNALKSRLA